MLPWWQRWPPPKEISWRALLIWEISASLISESEAPEIESNYRDLFAPTRHYFSRHKPLTTGKGQLISLYRGSSAEELLWSFLLPCALAQLLANSTKLVKTLFSSLCSEFLLPLLGRKCLNLKFLCIKVTWSIKNKSVVDQGCLGSKHRICGPNV